MGLEDIWDFAARNGADRLLLVNRRRGEPGEIRLLRLEDGRPQITYPVIFLKAIKLKREYNVKSRFVAEAVTADEGKNEFDVARSLASFLNLPLRSDRGPFCSFHVEQNHSGRLAVTLTSPAGIREVGPSLTIRHLAWSLHEEEPCEEHES